MTGIDWLKKKFPDDWREVLEEECPRTFSDELNIPADELAILEPNLDSGCLDDECYNCWLFQVEE